MTDWLMCVLTAIYVIATIFILRSNKKQLIESQKMRADSHAVQKQDVALQLLDRRLKSYYCLRDWVVCAKMLFADNSPIGSPLVLFEAMLFSDTKDNELKRFNSILKSIEIKLKEKGLTPEQKVELEHQRGQTGQDRFMYRLQLIGVERDAINQIEISYNNISFKTIQAFCEAFTPAFLNISNEINGMDPDFKASKKLKEQAQLIVDQQILESMWNEVKSISIIDSNND